MSSNDRGVIAFLRRLRPPGQLRDAPTLRVAPTLRDVPTPMNTLFTQLMSINAESEFLGTLTSMLASEEDLDTAMSLQGDDALTLVDILDRVSEPSVIAGFCSTSRTGT